MSTPSVLIRPMQPLDIEAVVSIHLASFEGFFLTFLGAGFLRLLYCEIMETPDSVALVAVDNDQIIGFVAGVAHQSGFYRQLVRRRLFAFALASLRAAVRRPSIFPRLFRALTYSRSTQGSASQAILMSIGVAPHAEGVGIGQRLVRAFLDEMANHSVDSVSLTTDRDNNDRTNRFYTKLGFKLANSYLTPEGRAMNEYVIQL